MFDLWRCAGRCPVSVASYAECAAAARALDLADTTPTPDGSQSAINNGLSYLTDPPECYTEYRADWGGLPVHVHVPTLPHVHVPNLPHVHVPGFGRRSMFVGGGGGSDGTGRLFWDSG